MSFLNSTKSSCSSYSSYVSSSTSELDVEQSSSSAKTFSVLPKSDTSVWQIGHSDFLGTETIESSDRVPDEFDANLEILKIAYKV
jgi:hypothetical protein